MSFYSDASLAMIPSGYKDQKVYSALPITGDGDLTFSRASSATRVASNGLIEKVRTNVVTYSEDFSNVSYVFDELSRTGGQTDPNGGTTASLFTATAAVNAYILKDFSTASGSIYTLSIYIKGAASGSISLRVDSGGTAAQNNISYTTSWQRFTYTFTAGAATSTMALGGYNTWTGTEAISIAFAQAELGDIATDYIATTSAAVSVGPVSGLPRLDYLDSSAPRLLLEPQRSNVFLYSEDITQTGAPKWVQFGGVTVTANDAISPDGYMSADKMNSTGGVYQQQTHTPSTNYAISVFIKNDTATSFKIDYVDQAVGYLGGSATYTFSTGAITIVQSANASITAEAVDYGNGWIRFILKMTANAAANYNYQQFNFNGGVGWVWGFQMEEGDYATSYIPTLGTSVTRVADAASKTGIGSLIGGTSGTIFFEIKTNKTLSAQGYKQFFYYSDASSAQAYMYLGSTNYIVTNPALGSITSSIALEPDTTYKVAIAYASNDFKLYINGVERGSSTGGTPIDAVNIISIGSYVGSSEFNEMTFGQYIHFKTRLTNAQLAELTTL